MIVTTSCTEGINSKIETLRKAACGFRNNTDGPEVFENIRVPVITVNGGLWPIDYEANRRHMFSFDAIVLKNADHFLMMNCAEEFNSALEKAIDMILGKKVQ